MSHLHSKVFVLSIMIVMVVEPALAQGPDTLWMRTWGGTDADGAYCLQRTSDNGFIVAGYQTGSGTDDDVCLIRTDSDGNDMWVRTYGGTGVERAHCAQQTSDGGFVIAAHTYSFGVGGQDVYIIKTDGSGSIPWYKTYGGSKDDVGYSIRETSDGGYIVAGSTNSFGAGSYDFYLLRLDAGGDSIWTKTYGGAGSEGARCVHQLPDGGYILLGSTTSFAVGGSDVWLVRTDSMGVVLWTERYGTSWNDYGYSIDLTADGGFIITGTTQLLSDAENDLFLIRTDSTGYALWTKAYGGSQTESGNSIKYLPDGGCIAAGWTRSFGAGFYDLYLVRTDAAGDTIWTQTYGGSGTDAGYSIELVPGGAYAIAGWTSTYGAGDHDIWLVRTGGDVAGLDKVLPTRVQRLDISISPNPAPGHTTLTYRSTSSSSVDIALYDIVGRRIREAISPETSKGTQHYAWDGTDSLNREVPPGVYFIRLQAGDQVATQKVVLIR